MCDYGDVHSTTFKGVVITKPTMMLILMLMYLLIMPGMSMSIDGEDNIFKANGNVSCAYLESNSELNCFCGQARDSSNEAVQITKLLSEADVYTSAQNIHSSQKLTSESLRQGTNLNMYSFVM